MKFITHVLFIIFNRPDTTRVVFEEIRKIKPAKLFVVADYPREDKEGEKEKCAETRQIIENDVDWECEVFKNYADVNMSCGTTVGQGNPQCLLGKSIF